MAYGVFRKTIIPILLRRLGSVEGVENIPARGPFLVAANHVSYIEPALISMLAIQRTGQKVYSLTKDGIWRFFRKLGMADRLGMVRLDPEARERCVDDCVAKLHEGYPVVIFPEGTRNRSETLLRAKTGVARIALRSSVPVVPIGYRGPAGMTTAEAVRNALFSAKNIHIRVGQPMAFTQEAREPLTNELLHRVADTIMRRIAELAGSQYPY